MMVGLWQLSADNHSKEWDKLRNRTERRLYLSCYFYTRKGINSMKIDKSYPIGYNICAQSSCGSSYRLLIGRMLSSNLAGRTADTWKQLGGKRFFYDEAAWKRSTTVEVGVVGERPSLITRTERFGRLSDSLKRLLRFPVKCRCRITAIIASFPLMNSKEYRWEVADEGSTPFICSRSNHW